MAEYDVARMTARQALGVLQAEGLTDTRKGAGVFVRTFRPLRRRAVQRLAAEQWTAGRSVWADEVDDRQLLVDQVEVAERPAPRRAADRLGPPAGPVCVRSRRYTLDGKPVLFAVSYLPADLVAGSRIVEEDTGPGGVYARLAELGHRPVRFVEEVRSRMPRPEETQRLSLPAGTPVVRLCRTAFAEDGRPVEVNDMTLDASAFVLEYDFPA
jgi:GntR family transcriptional regulator